MNLFQLFRITVFILSIGAYSGCSQNKIPSDFHYHEVSKGELGKLNVNDTDKAYQLQVTQLDSDSAEISFLKIHPVYCPLTGFLTRSADTIYMDIGQMCDPSQTEFVTETATVRFIWRLKLKDLGNYRFIPRETGSGKTWPILVEK
ncbi:hypothetical protein [Rufibacter tibetensis]|uniref:Uncharacterized protein n=1 Tax=Rufibacter tibetensis TaxID=512763 RepID=A0A0P0C6R8_9BACT|nr:hypothetical protein [Rufibacter tibetensis]ALJ00708.1 hypothetical protein DC20_19150 [Rufibacter tibetensis]